MEAISEAGDVNCWNSLRHKLHNIKCTMMKHPDLVCLCVFTLFWFISKFSKSVALKPLLHNQPLPETIFPPHSPVHDSFTGSLAYLSSQVRDDELAVVMFYAPWSVRALEARAEFHKAAEMMNEQLNFLAVNCWWPNGQCVKKYKFYSFPAIYVYHNRAQRFRYTGALTAEHLVQFLERFLYPMTPIYSVQHMNEFMLTHDPFVVGHFDFHDSPQPPGLKQYYFSALRHLQKNPAHPLRFAVVVNPALATSYNMSRTPCVQFNHLTHHINKSFTRDNFTSTNLQSWLSDFLIYQPTISWLHLPGRKSRYLRDLFKLGPGILVFLPNNPLYHNRLYTNMQKVIYEFGACDNATRYTPSLFDQYLERSSPSTTTDCQDASPLSSPPSSSSAVRQPYSCCSSLALTTDDYRRCNVCRSAPTTDVCGDMSTILSHLRSSSERLRCGETRYNYYSQQWTSLCCETGHQPLQARTKDPNVRRLLSKSRELNCAKLAHSQVKGLPTPRTFEAVWRRFDEAPMVDGFRGLSCRTNRTFAVSVLDARLHDSVRRSLRLGRRRASGVDVVLVDAQREEHYLLRKPFNRHSMAEFIMNYTSDELTRAVRSRAGADGRAGAEELSCTQSHDCVLEVTTDNFQRIVLDEKKDVLLFHYAPWCGQCLSMGDTYFRLARLFKRCSNLTISRVNGDENDLPWQYSSATYPTIQYYPAGRKAESVTLPDDVPRTVPNLVRFVLRHASAHVRVRAVAHLCGGPCRFRNIQRIHRFKEEKAFDLSLLYSRLETALANKEKDSYVRDLESRIRNIEERMRRIGKLDQLLLETSSDPINDKRLADVGR